jgi:DNA-binding CsgD family transcriptional regulator
MLLHAAPAAADPRPGVLVLSGDLGVVATTPEAAALLEQLEPAPHLPLPTVVYAVVAALRSERPDPSARVRGASGAWLALHASHLDGADAGRVAVVIERCTPRATLTIRLAASGLSQREAEVARLVLRGSSTRAISTALHISPHTVQDHLKHVFDKLGVRSRRDLVGLMLGGH